MRNILKKHWPLWAAVGVLLTVMTAVYVISLELTRGHFIYSLDDAYIHMAMAKHLAQDGVWGVTRYEFTSATSSPLWTFAISVLYMIFGVREMTPFVLNILLSAAVMAALYCFLYRYGLSSSARLLIPLGIAFLMPLPALVFTGMEAVASVLLSTLFACIAAGELAGKKSTRSSLKMGYLAVLAPLVTSIRYEGLFLVFVVCVLLLLRRRWLDALVTGVFALLPVIFYGRLSMVYGWHPLPNSVTLHGKAISDFGVKSILSFLYSGHLQLLSDMVLLFTIAAILLLLSGRGSVIHQEGRMLAVIFISTSILHMLFSSAGIFFRYESYLITIGLLALSCIASDRLRVDKRNIYQAVAICPALLLVILLLPPVVSRGTKPILRTPQSCGNIHDQQYQMALFLKQFYSGKPVIANDIGAINYFADIKCVDIVGIASLEVSQMKREDLFSQLGIQALAQVKSVEAILIYERWLGGGIPPDWIKVGQWRIPNNYIAGDDTVSFYATDASKASELARNLEEFASRLPTHVEYQSMYR